MQGLSDLWQLMQQQGVAVDAIPSLLMDAEAHNLSSTLVAHLRQLEARSSSSTGGAVEDSAAPSAAAGQLQAQTGGSSAGSRLASSGGGGAVGVGGPTLDDLKQRLNLIHQQQAIAKASPAAVAPEAAAIEEPVAETDAGGESPAVGGGLIGTSGRASGGGVQHNSMMQSLRDRMKGLKT
jgi:hypothetical protein